MFIFCIMTKLLSSHIRLPAKQKKKQKNRGNEGRAVKFKSTPFTAVFHTEGRVFITLNK